MPTYAPSWEQTSPSTPPVHMGGGGTLTHRENVGAGAHVLPAESGQQLTHCCQIPPGLLGQFSQKNSAAGEKFGRKLLPQKSALYPVL